MVSLIVAMCTFHKQWTFYEMVKSVDDDLTKDFAVIIPKKIFRLLAELIIIVLSLFLLLVVVITYFIYIHVLKINSFFLCLSSLLANFPYFCIVLMFYCSTSSISIRFHVINSILRQLSPKNVPKNTFELCSRTSQNDRLKPTIALDEIFSIYLNRSSLASPPNKNFIKKEIMELTSKIERNEENTWLRLKKQNIIEVEEFKMTKMANADFVIEHLTKLLDMHDVLLDCLIIQNELLSFQILLIVAQIFVFGVFAFFSLYRTAMYNIASASNILAFSNGFWLLVYVAMLFIIMNTATKCVSNGKFTGTCCHKVINNICTSTDQRIVEKVSLKLM